MLDAKTSLVPTHQIIVPSTLLAPATEIRAHKATEIHTLKPLTYELFFQNSSKMEINFQDSKKLSSLLIFDGNISNMWYNSKLSSCYLNHILRHSFKTYLGIGLGY